MSALIEACNNNKFPNLDVLCNYGLDGRDGVNPIKLFSLYQTAISKNKITANQLENAMKNDTLSEIVGIQVRSGWKKNSRRM